ncbi:VOC family protein [uncultured Fluviicola sp.]|jgi:predicted enzyme related to lactoylglutathione lyase|uniref:VOC family protein n=1 Tax=uncultured Fluviicola sp. TaxID=463303 RepID=UPI0025EC833F|nr:VOC family protein [uncultured Fluviicola sp.]
MDLASVRIITADIKQVVSFFEHITALPAVWYTEDFAEIEIGSVKLAVGSTRTLNFFGEGMAVPASNKSVIIEFRVDNVDEVYERIKDSIGEKLVQQPTTMPWGNRSLLFRDPDGNLINFFTPKSTEALERFQ